MRKPKQVEPHYSFLSNVIYMFKAHWKFDKIFLFLPIVKIPLSVGASLIGVVMPKIVLDALTNTNIKVNTMMMQIFLCSAILVFFQVFSTKVDSIYKIRNNQFFLLYGFTGLFEKKMDMDYQIFSSPLGKVSAKKAEMASQGNIHTGISSFFRSITEFFTNFFGFMAFTAVLISLNPVIILLLLLSYGIDGLIALAMERFNYKDRDKWSEVYRKRSYISSRIGLSMFAKDIRLYSLTGWLNAVYQAITNDELKLTSRRARRQMIQMLFEGVLIFVRDGFVYWYLIHKFLTSDMEIGNFTVYFAAIAGFGTWLTDMVAAIYDLQDINHSVCDYRAFMEMEDTTIVPDGIKMADKKGPFSIRLEHVSFTYPESDKIILDDINLEIQAGENLALVGVNGAGKTTLAKLICGLIRPTKGEIYIDDVNVRKIDREEYFKLCAAVFQDISFMPVGIDENITFEKYPDEHELNMVLQAADLDNKVKQFSKGVKTRMMSQFNEGGIEFSGGEMQKLLLARALYKNAPILILDEPTAALDPIAENELYLKYRELTDGKTSVYISHRLSSTRFCDRIVLLDGTKIAEVGTHEELMKSNGGYAKMFFTSSQYYMGNEE